MTWLNPLALLGVVALGVPILIHLFGRRVARRLRFPSLRLLGIAMPTPATRSVPSDLLLLIVRCAIILAAVLALAQPRFLTGERARDAARPVRVILVDTSASMKRLTSDGPAIDAARHRGRALLDSARSGILLETGDPGSSLAGAAAWLARHGGVREVVVVSDFQVGAVEASQVGALPDGIGVRLERVAVTESARPSTLAGIDSLAADSSGTMAWWASVRVDSLTWPALPGMASESALGGAHTRAIRALTGRELRPTNRVAVVFHGNARWDELAAQASPLDSAWHGDLLVALRRNATFADFARTANAAAGCNPPGAPFATTASGAHVSSIARTGASVVVFACVDAASVEATALVMAVATGLDQPQPVGEFEPLLVPDAALEQWRRDAVPSAPRGSDETSPDGRWLWLIALVLLGVEEWLRRKSPRRVAVQEREVARARVA